ncbi:MAG: DUF5105 domain-containing protein [Coriobacteriia bacterium]|nr:DUF5105 domain-containing protein [Coriobacteriia bacterium]
MKKFLTLMLVGVLSAMALVLAGCSETTPTEVVKNELTAVQSQSKAGDGAKVDVMGIITQTAEDTDKLTDKDKEYLSSIVTKLTDFDFEVGEEAIDGDTATVEVTFKSYPSGKTMESVLTSYVEKVFNKVAAGKELSDEEYQTMLFEEMDTKFQAMDKKSFEKTVKLNLTKKDGSWEMDDLTVDQMDAMLGGFYSTINELTQSSSK